MRHLSALWLHLTVPISLWVMHYRTRHDAPERGQVWAGPKRTLLAVCDITHDGAVVVTKGVPEAGRPAQSYEVPLSAWRAFVARTRLARCGTWAL